MKHRSILIPVIVAAAALIAAVVTWLTGIKPEPAKDAAVHLQSAQKYLVELDYDRAIAEFEAAIQIDPMNVDAYIGLAKVYEAQGDVDKVIGVLEDGYEKTGDSRLQVLIDELIMSDETVSTTENTTVKETIDETTAASSIDSNRYYWESDGDKLVFHSKEYDIKGYNELWEYDSGVLISYYRFYSGDIPQVGDVVEQFNYDDDNPGNYSYSKGLMTDDLYYYFDRNYIVSWFIHKDKDELSWVSVINSVDGVGMEWWVNGIWVEDIDEMVHKVKFKRYKDANFLNEIIEERWLNEDEEKQFWNVFNEAKKISDENYYTINELSEKNGVSPEVDLIN